MYKVAFAYAAGAGPSAAAEQVLSYTDFIADCLAEAHAVY